MTGTTLIPVAGIDDDAVIELEHEKQPGLTYRMRVDMDNGLDGQISGRVDGLAAVEQAAYKILSTERGEYEIYPNLGIETVDLYGQPLGYVIPELERRVIEALTQDDRINSVDSFVFDIPRRGVIHFSCVIRSTEGNVAIERDVEVE